MIDLRPAFKHVEWRPMPHSQGVLVGSDWADKSPDDPVFGLYKRCGLWTLDEAQILAESAYQFHGHALDIGSHTGWTMAHLLKTGCGDMNVEGVDPMYSMPAFLQRTFDNLIAVQPDGWSLFHGTALEYFADIEEDGEPDRLFDVICIDGDHSPGKPLEDAVNAVAHLAERGVILFHDCVGQPVQEAVEYCVSQGMQCKAYKTVHGVAVCWRGEFTPPKHDGPPVRVNLGSIERFV